VDVVPLFETLDDLTRAPEIMKSLLASDAYRRQLRARGNRQEVMIGYSDSGKDAGILASSWALYEAQERLTTVFSDAGIALQLFHGRGGSVGRGGGSPVYRALAALPPGTVNGRIKITEQGEIVSQQFGLLPVAERTLEVTLAGVLMQAFNPGPDDPSAAEMLEFRDAMTDLAHRGLDVLQRMARRWPFFDDLLSKIEMVCAKSDMEIARLYVQQLGGDVKLFERLKAEFDATVNAILRIRQSDALMRDTPVMQSAIMLRNPYVDPLSLIQVSLLRQRPMDGPAEPTPDSGAPTVDSVLSTTLSGIAQGLRNTG
jgi:phosphoenolpyruvate carboxylase